MDTDLEHGLSQSQVKKQRKRYGYNELPDHEKKNIVRIVLEILREPMIFLLVAVVVVYALLGDRTEAIVLAVSVFVIVGIELFQNHRTEKALSALRNLSSPRCEVIRDGKHITIAGREVVPGDIVLLSEGSRVPADGELLSGQNVMIDESLLTGESVAVHKALEASGNVAVFSGTLVVKGHGIARVTKTGEATEIGAIGSSLKTIKTEKTLLTKETERVVKLIAIIAITLAVLLTLGFWVLRNDLLQGFLAGLTLSIAILPEEFPVVLTVFMALGAWRLAKSNVLSRKSQTIETLGSATVLCTDKTGTLTENRMQVQLVTDDTGEALSPESELYQQVINNGVLASQKKPFDPMEEAFIEAAANVHTLYGDEVIVKEYPLEPTSFSVVHAWGNDKGAITRVAVKGAPETVFALCKLPAKHVEQLKERVKTIASEGLRVIAVGSATPQQNLPETREKLDYTFHGLVALADPIRKEAKAAVALCRQAGIRVIMITGDYAETARRIGKEIGLDTARVMTGEEFEKLSPTKQREAIEETSVFSRVSPSNKLTIVEALKHNKHVVAMTGDGVNDAPALKAAHIGIAMGQRGTDVAREASSIVLLDDNFASIVQGIRTGRRIFANLQKAMAYILTVHIPIALLSLVPVLFGWELVLLPIHIVFLEFIIDPSCTLIFEGESEEPDAMKKPPRSLHQPLFSKAVVFRSLMQGLAISIFIIVMHWWFLTHGWSTDKARAATFLLVVLTNVLIIVAISGRRATREAFSGKINAMLIVLVLVGLSLAAVYLIEPIRQLFKLAPLSMIELMVVAFLALSITYISTRFVKHLHYR